MASKKQKTAPKNDKFCIDCESNDSDVHEVIEDGFSNVRNDFVYESSYEIRCYN